MSTETIAHFLTSTSYEQLPPEVIKRARVAIQDHVALLVAASRNEAAVAMREFGYAMGGREEATLVGSDLKISCPVAAMVNTLIAKTLGGFEDGAYRDVGFLCHCGGTILATALAVTEYQKGTGKDLIEAVVMGYEVAMRAAWISRLAGKFDMIETYAAAAIASKALRLSPDEAIDALGLAEARNYSLFNIRPRPNAKIPPFQLAAAWGAMTGVTASLLPRFGFSGSYTIFDLSPQNQEPLNNLGVEWEIMRQFVKVNNNCRWCDAPIDGVRELVSQHNLNPDSIASIQLGVAEQAITSVGNATPTTAFEAMFSLPFVIGAVLIDGEMGLDQTSEAKLHDPRILAQARKVELVSDPEAESLRPEKAAARVTIKTTDNREFETYVVDPKGSAEKPLSEEELTRKFKGLVTRVIDDTAADELLNRISQVETLDSVSALTDMMRT
jgi:2-methylcitrate dehydratase PrpD